jgi:hypothetical protein
LRPVAEREDLDAGQTSPTPARLGTREGRVEPTASCRQVDVEIGAGRRVARPSCPLWGSGEEEDHALVERDPKPKTAAAGTLSRRSLVDVPAA